MFSARSRDSLLLLGAPATGPAQGPPGTAALKEKSAALAAESRATLLQLYALESRLGQARSDLARIDARAAAARTRQQDAARRRHAAAQQTLAVAQQRLAAQLRLLYEQDQPDPIAVVLGATSLADGDRRPGHAQPDGAGDEAGRRAGALGPGADPPDGAGPRRRAEHTRAARRTLAATAAGLEQAQSERAAYLAQVRRSRR